MSLSTDMCATFPWRLGEGDGDGRLALGDDVEETGPVCSLIYEPGEDPRVYGEGNGLVGQQWGRPGPQTQYERVWGRWPVSGHVTLRPGW